ncbi:leucine-rich repeat domain-containing protein [Pseudomonas sp. UV AK001]|uniref:leucine-rich repeat domain-containing protein n=1 Tax=Pseudomonas sp. UV AK001 TaxID=3384791 RepID=UPI0038D39EB3
MSAGALASQRQKREKFSQDLLAIWRRESVPGQGSADHSFSTFIDFSGELPHLSARFEWVTELVLTARNTEVSLGRFLDSFPNVRYLIPESVRMEELSPAIFQMRDLQHLVLNGNSLRLSESNAEGLSGIEILTLLNLRENPLDIAPPVGFMQGLRELFLRDCAIGEFSSGMERLSALTRVDLRENNIATVGDELFDIPDAQNLHLDLRVTRSAWWRGSESHTIWKMPVSIVKCRFARMKTISMSMTLQNQATVLIAGWNPTSDKD